MSSSNLLPQSSLATSQLFNENTFYHSFIQDLWKCREEIIIESPFITTLRMNDFRSVFRKKIEEGIKICVFTRDPREHDLPMATQAEVEIQFFERIGIQTLICTGNHHRKLAILDREISWEGSLNILSQTHSREIMRKIENEKLTMKMFNFLKLARFIV